MVLWLSTDFGDFPNFWWGVPLKSGVSQKRLRNLQLTIASAIFPKVNQLIDKSFDHLKYGLLQPFCVTKGDYTRPTLSFSQR